jgi:hypothetical protein
MSKMAMFLFSVALFCLPLAQAEPTKCVIINGALCCWNPQTDGFYPPLSCQ